MSIADEFEEEPIDDFDSDYPEPSNIQDEEAHFHWTISEFESLVDNYGAELVFSKLDGYIIDKIKEHLNG